MLRKSKKVREVVEKHKSSFQPLIKEFGNDKIISILKELLAGRIFQSELRAKVEFPELFRSSPARTCSERHQKMMQHAQKPKP